MRNILSAIAVLALLPAPAQAHIVASRLGDFYAGALHPLTGLEDVILWLALAGLASLQPETRARWVVLLFPAGLLAGLALGLASGNGGTLGPAPGMTDAGMMVVVGGLLALALRMPPVVFYIVALALGLARGAANVAGMDQDTNVVLFGGGLVVAGYATVTLVTAVLRAFIAPGAGWRTVTMRAVGSWIAAVGLMLGGFALRGH